MTLATDPRVPLRSPDRFFIGGEWVAPSSDATIDVIDSGTEQVYFRVPEAQPADMDLAIEAARRAFDRGPWPRTTHAERAEFLRAMADKLKPAPTSARSGHASRESCTIARARNPAARPPAARRPGW
jgi:hypothetical protein